MDDGRSPPGATEAVPLQALADTLPHPAALVRGGVIVSANVRLCSVLGRTSSELAGRGIADLLDPSVSSDEVVSELDRSAGDAAAPPVSARLLCARGYGVEVLLGSSHPVGTGMQLVVAAVVQHPAAHPVTTTLRDALLRREEERFRTLVEISSDWLWEVDADGRYSYVSPTVRYVLGYEPAEMIGRTPFEFIVPEDVDGVRERFEAAVEARRPFRLLENTCRHRDGYRVVLETSGVPIVEPDGRLAGYRGVDRDVTDRRSAEAAIRRAEARYRGIVDGSPMGFHEYLLEPGGRLVFTGANRAADEILGVANRRFVGRSLEEAFPALAGTEIPERYREVCRSGRPWSAEQVDYDHGEIRGAFQVHAYQAAADRVAVLFLDVTARARAEAALRDSERRFRTLAHNVPVGVFRSSPDDRRPLEFANPALAGMFGATVDELLGRPVAELYADPAERAAWKERLMDEGGVVGHEVRFRRLDGGGFWGAVSAQAVRGDDGGVVSIDGTVVDVTERWSARDHLLGALERLTAELAEPVVPGGVRDAILAEVRGCLDRLRA